MSAQRYIVGVRKLVLMTTWQIILVYVPGFSTPGVWSGDTELPSELAMWFLPQISIYSSVQDKMQQCWHWLLIPSIFNMLWLILIVHIKSWWSKQIFRTKIFQHSVQKHYRKWDIMVIFIFLYFMSSQDKFTTYILHEK